MTDAERDAQQKEVHANYLAFQKMQFPDSDTGKFALMKDGKVLELVYARPDAHILAKHIIPGSRYSIQEVNPRIPFIPTFVPARFLNKKKKA